MKGSFKYLHTCLWLLLPNPQSCVHITDIRKQGRKEMFYLTTHSTHFIYGYMASDIWLRTILIVRKETRCRHIGYSFRLTARVLFYAPSHSLCYTSRGALAGTRNSSMGPPHEGSIRRPIAPWANTLTTQLHLVPQRQIKFVVSNSSSSCLSLPPRYKQNWIITN